MSSTTYQVMIGERSVRVRLRHDAAALFAQVDDGDEVPVAFETVRDVLRLLTVGEQRREVMAARAPSGVSVAFDGLAIDAEVEDEAHARLAQVTAGRSAAHGRRELRAPMPGLVVNVLTSVGDAIEAGQPLVVLQAMKMENELALPRGGTVSAVHVAAGQTVESGQMLIVVE
jgi:biotin carboxyl carrier protein